MHLFQFLFINFENLISEIEFILLESDCQKIETTYQNARSLKVRIKNDVELTE